jgi:hypothetical protein
MVLLKNRGNILPLTAGLHVAFIGPHANATTSLLSNYHGTNKLVDTHSPLQAAVAAGMHVTYTKGCNICDLIPTGYPNMLGVRFGLGQTFSFEGAIGSHTCLLEAIMIHMAFLNGDLALLPV